MIIDEKKNMGEETFLECRNYMFGGDDVHDMEFVRGDGIYLYTSDGEQYMDCAAGTFNLSLGYSNPEVIEAVKNQCDKLVHCTSSYANSHVYRLAKKLVEVAPDNITRAHTKVSGGSTANEGAVKLAQFYTGKKEVISFYRAHVGQTIFMQMASGLSVRKQKFQFSSDGIAHMEYPYCYRCPYAKDCSSCDVQCLHSLEEYASYGGSNIACLIIEPILGNGGNMIPPKKYFQRLKELCDSLGIVLIFDEIQTGIGRTGKMFAAQYFDVQPNIITCAKGLGGSGFQVAGILMEEKFNKMDSYLHSFTYGSNILSCTAAEKTLEIIDNKDFLDNVTVCGDYIVGRLNKMYEKYNFIGDVRGAGLMIGIEIVKDRITKEPDVKLTKYIAKKAFDDEKMMIRTSLYGFGNVLKFRPSLNITLEECEEMMDKFDSVLASL